MRRAAGVRAMRAGAVLVLWCGLVAHQATLRAQTSTLDIADTALVLDYTPPETDPTAQIRTYIISGRGTTGFGATWTGLGITSSTAAADVIASPESTSVAYAHNGSLPLGPYATFEGRAVDDTALLIRYTRTGDANLDGLVDDNDVTILSATYAPGVSQPAWALGDFDYNGFVDDDDLTLLGVFYDPNASPIGGLPFEASGSRSTSDESIASGGAAPAHRASVAAVPEPATELLLLLGTAGALLFHSYRWRRKT